MQEKLIQPTTLKGNIMKSLHMTVLAALLACSSIAASHDHKGDAASKSSTAVENANALTSGEVKKVDKDTGKLTIKHGPITNLDMPPMTMVFKVKDPAMLTQVKVGDKINFSVERVEGAITVTRIEAVK
jgi:Cu(I)/Ag(I) efflux system protein CusF